MNTFVLKLIAISAMLIDHIGATMVPSNTLLYLIMRSIGRLAFPLFVFMIVEGFHHTSDIKKYLIRLGLFAIISEVPFDLAFYNTVLEGGHQNVFFTLFLGLLCINLIDKMHKKYATNPFTYNFLAGLLTLFFSLFAVVLRTDYNYAGILLIVAFYLFRGNKLLTAFALFFVSAYILGNINGLAILAIVPIIFYNGKKGKSAKYLFYVFYPGHLIVLAIIKMLMY